MKVGKEEFFVFDKERKAEVRNKMYILFPKSI